MFTGIVTHRGELVSLRPAQTDDSMTELRIRATPAFDALVLGESIALDGTCLTVSAIDGDVCAFQAIPETLRCTTLGALEAGHVVNMERALRMGDAMGGHWVQGHVDGVGRLAERTTKGEDVRFVISVEDTLFDGLLPKGSVTLDGVSLTVGEVWREANEGRFSVYLIPHTLHVTGLGAKQPGDRLNIEADILGRWVARHVERMLASGAPDQS